MLVRKEHDGQRYSYLAYSKSHDLRDWTTPRTLTPADKHLEYGSPGDVIRVGKEWVLCLQTYPRPHGERYGTADSRIWTMRSRDLEHWDAPALLRVKGPGVPQEAMGRIIDPFLLADKDQSNLWWCFYKQNGISISRSNDLVHWQFFGGCGGESMRHRRRQKLYPIPLSAKRNREEDFTRPGALD